mmetsp:Transcript_13581/g.33392  ORF Transcript_13581/g.33392 Transcript_13581/m.33392 type:complete len:130 (+) Transcript_13581:117-506(+)|eukprot:CAMPEP_0178994594 /NCGR_PEP_ID=MMETSP0795-20121207/7358_1 /TAXON_ID=88552 /ORGANISM="Amoebophrya sp., Strain Ameob2" /LENGTH=129 /DNA_ID=CAMNT_0020686807 /DNA_START=116 /DNA_END=505 /DNA_ORIENTATION=+
MTQNADGAGEFTAARARGQRFCRKPKDPIHSWLFGNGATSSSSSPTGGVERKFLAHLFEDACEAEQELHDHDAEQELLEEQLRAHKEKRKRIAEKAARKSKTFQEAINDLEEKEKQEAASSSRLPTKKE